MYRTLETDLLIIGGGGAGATAAVRAHDAGLRVLLVVKGFLGKSGCSIFVSHVPYYDESTVEKAAARLAYPVRYYNHFLVDQEYVKRMGAWVRTQFNDETEKMGIYWRRDNSGAVVHSLNQVPISVAYKQGKSGPLIMELRRRQIISRGIPLMEETMITQLLVRDNVCVGAMAMSLRTGEVFAIRAKKTMLASGHSDYLATRATGTREQSADGIAMALRAGADIINLEIQWWHATDIGSPPAWMRYHLYPNPLLDSTESSRMYNSKGEVFFEQKTTSPGSSAPYPNQMRHLAMQVEKGLARFDGGYYTGWTHVDREVVMTYQHQAKVWENLKLDVSAHLLECGATLHMRQGGIDVNTQTMQTSVDGLYAIGGVGGHYLGGMGPVFFDATTAVAHAAEQVRGMDVPELQVDQANAEEDRLMGLLRAKPEHGCYPIEVKNAIRQVMYENMGYVKDEQGMNEALARFADIRERMLPGMGLRSTSMNYNSGWTDAIDVYNMLDSCEATVRSGLQRKESRGPFYRRDYPVIDNENWLVKVIQRMEGREPRFRTEPYATPYLQPPVLKQPFFEADY